MDGKGRQALHHACQHGLTRLVDSLLQRGASAEARAGKLRQTPLMIGEEGGGRGRKGGIVGGEGRAGFDGTCCRPLHSCPEREGGGCAAVAGLR